MNLCFEHPVDGPEATFFSRQEKEVICELLSNFGLPILSGDSGNKVDYKSDFAFIRSKMLDKMKLIKSEEAIKEQEAVADEEGKQPEPDQPEQPM